MLYSIKKFIYILSKEGCEVFIQNCTIQLIRKFSQYSFISLEDSLLEVRFSFLPTSMLQLVSRASPSSVKFHQIHGRRDQIEPASGWPEWLQEDYRITFEDFGSRDVGNQETI